MGWDSNPRGAVNPWRFSRPLPSTARPPIRSCRGPVSKAPRIWPDRTRPAAAHLHEMDTQRPIARGLCNRSGKASVIHKKFACLRIRDLSSKEIRLHTRDCMKVGLWIGLMRISRLRLAGSEGVRKCSSEHDAKTPRLGTWRLPFCSFPAASLYQRAPEKELEARRVRRASNPASVDAFPRLCTCTTAFEGCSQSRSRLFANPGDHLVSGQGRT